MAREPHIANGSSATMRRPVESFDIEFELRAKETGFWTGGVDACTPTQNYVSDYAEIEVVAP